MDGALPSEVVVGPAAGGGRTITAVAAAMLAAPAKVGPPASDPVASDLLGTASSVLRGADSTREKAAPCSTAAPLDAVPLAAGTRCAFRAPPLAPFTTTRKSRSHWLKVAPPLSLSTGARSGLTLCLVTRDRPSGSPRSSRSILFVVASRYSITEARVERDPISRTSRPPSSQGCGQTHAEMHNVQGAQTTPSIFYLRDL